MFLIRWQQPGASAKVPAVNRSCGSLRQAQRMRLATHLQLDARLHCSAAQSRKHIVNRLKWLRLNGRLDVTIGRKIQGPLEVLARADDRPADRQPLQHHVEDWGCEVAGWSPNRGRVFPNVWNPPCSSRKSSAMLFPNLPLD